LGDAANTASEGNISRDGAEGKGELVSYYQTKKNTFDALGVF
jgi:hypothetical protein